ncbi:MAG: putative baseplate assembly protein [Polyangiaceae bacterium]
MSRPPRFRTAYSTTGEPLPGRSVLDYLPADFADLVDEERALASAELGFPERSAQGDFAATLMEMAALLGHTLGAYQDRYANDAFLGTAQSAKALVRHGRRLGYEPGPGLSATGYSLLTLKKDVTEKGTVVAGLGVGSAAAGEKKAQDYETLEDLVVSPDWAEMLPEEWLAQVVLSGQYSFQVEGTDLGITEGDFVVIQKAGGALSAHEIAAPPTESGGLTRLAVKQPLSGMNASFDGAVLWALPAHDLHLFGWDTSAASFTESELHGGQFPQSPASYPASGYVVTPAYTASDVQDRDLYLSAEIKKSISGSPAMRVAGASLTPLTIASETAKNVTFQRRTHVYVEIPTDPSKPEGPMTPVLDEYPTVSVSKTVTVVQAKQGATFLQRSAQNIRASRWLLGFGLSVPLVTREPSKVLAANPGSTPVKLDREIPDLEPGRLVALAERRDDNDGRYEIVRLTTVGTWPSKISGKSGEVLEVKTQVTWEPVEPAEPGPAWELGNLRLLGNVARMSHGKAVSEVLGDSDGSTPFLRFSLKQTPLTYLPGKDGPEPELAIRVSDVLWTRVVDFESSTPEDRHYLVQRDESGVVSVVFGDGTKGAIPPSGKKHIAAGYRIGIGPDGDAEPFAVSRLKKAHPLVQGAANPLSMAGGAAPADAADVRERATLYIRTFDRAVSVEDHKQLALTYEGIVKASAVWTELSSGGEGIRVVVADEKGTASTAQEVRAFLEERRDTTVPLEVAGPVLIGLTLTLYLEIDPAFLQESVERAVRDALCSTSEEAPGLFAFAARDLGQPAFLSEVYERIERAAGVRFVDVRRFDSLEEVEKGTAERVVDTVIARPDEVLVLSPQDIAFLPPEAT